MRGKRKIRKVSFLRDEFYNGRELISIHRVWVRVKLAKICKVLKFFEKRRETMDSLIIDPIE